MDVRFENNVHIGVIVPRPLVEALDAEAQRELISRSTWVRRLILNALTNKSAESKVSA
jgi:metal-responsive CopG/Arc/MetJ family transcriptional regulator